MQGPKLNAVSSYRLTSGSSWRILLPCISWLCSCSSSRGCCWPLCCQDRRLAHAQLTVHWEPQALFHRAAARLSVPNPCYWKGLACARGRTWLFLPVEHRKILVSPFLQPSQDGSPALEFMDSPSQWSVICKRDESAVLTSSRSLLMMIRKNWKIVSVIASQIITFFFLIPTSHFGIVSLPNE